MSDVSPLAGGQGTAYGTGHLVLKPAGDVEAAEWLAATLDALRPSSTLRIVRPVRAGTGAWVVGGWSAWERLAGAEAAERWRDALDVSDRFHSVAAEVAWSPAIRRNDAWALGDAFAWGEHDVPIPPVLAATIRELVDRRVPVNLPCQLVHGDLCGNILFDDELPPAVIDVSPYWRPKRYADAILVVDAMAWHGAGTDALETLLDPAGVQMLVRALLFRLGTAAAAFDDHADGHLTQQLLAYERVLKALDRR